MGGSLSLCVSLSYLIIWQQFTRCFGQECELFLKFPDFHNLKSISQWESVRKYLYIGKWRELVDYDFYNNRNIKIVGDIFITFFHVVLMLFITFFNFINSFPFDLFSFWFLCLLFPTHHAHSSPYRALATTFTFYQVKTFLLWQACMPLEYTTIIAENSAFLAQKFILIHKTYHLSERNLNPSSLSFLFWK